MITKFDAIVSLRPHCGFELHEDGTINWWNTEHTCPTEAEINAEITRLQNEYNAKQYHRDRQVTYKSIEEQLDMQYWDKVNGTNLWQEHIDAVKAAYPKPTE